MPSSIPASASRREARPAGPEAPGPIAGAYSRSWRDFRRNPLAKFGAATIVVLLCVAVFAPWLAPRDPEAIDYFRGLAPPGRTAWLGTDPLGRDTLSRLIFATRVSLVVGLGVASLSVLIGAALGAVAGWSGGWVDSVISRLMDVLWSIPMLPLVMVIGAFIKITPPLLVLLLGGISWVGVARLVRAQALSLREQEFIAAARSIGLPGSRIVIRHILPNTTAPMVVAGTLSVASAILVESALSFLGFGVDPSTPTWGNMLQNAQNYLVRAPWLSIFPGAMIALTVASFNFVGDGLREAFDPRLKGR
ncbi:MAG: ABC transporter permease [Armatimonadota bacterium]|nr:ABC transporter permease [Armatimonadota bacterium]